MPWLGWGLATSACRGASGPCCVRWSTSGHWEPGWRCRSAICRAWVAWAEHRSVMHEAQATQLGRAPCCVECWCVHRPPSCSGVSPPATRRAPGIHQMHKRRPCGFVFVTMLFYPAWLARGAVDLHQTHHGSYAWMAAVKDAQPGRLRPITSLIRSVTHTLPVCVDLRACCAPQPKRHGDG